MFYQNNNNNNSNSSSLFSYEAPAQNEEVPVTTTTTSPNVALKKKKKERKTPSSPSTSPIVKKRTRGPMKPGRKRFLWTPKNHQLFLLALQKIEALKDVAVPSRILQELPIEGITRDHVASHLQKHRKQLRALREGHTRYFALKSDKQKKQEELQKQQQQEEDYEFYDDEEEEDEDDDIEYEEETCSSPSTSTYNSSSPASQSQSDYDEEIVEQEASLNSLYDTSSCSYVLSEADLDLLCGTAEFGNVQSQQQSVQQQPQLVQSQPQVQLQQTQETTYQYNTVPQRTPLNDTWLFTSYGMEGDEELFQYMDKLLEESSVYGSFNQSHSMYGSCSPRVLMPETGIGLVSY